MPNTLNDRARECVSTMIGRGTITPDQAPGVEAHIEAAMLAEGCRAADQVRAERPKRDDSGPAFPTHPPERNQYHEVCETTDSGMSLRDWFAGRFAAEMLGATLVRSEADTRGEALYGDRGIMARAGDVAGVAYRVADAMLAERAKGGK